MKYNVRRDSLNSDSCLRPWRWKNIAPAVLILFAGLAMIPWAKSIYLAFYHGLRALPLASFFSTLRQFSTFTILLGIVFLIYLLDRKRARFIPYFVCALLVSGAVGTTLKQVCGRTRPEWSVVSSKNKRAELREYQASHPEMDISIAKTDHWFGLTWPRPFFRDRYSSFPSGHATAAFVIAAFLVLLYPEARVVWFVGAIGCALSRVRGERHYVEDVMVAGAMAWILSQWVFSWRWPLLLGMRWFGDSVDDDGDDGFDEAVERPR